MALRKFVEFFEGFKRPTGKKEVQHTPEEKLEARINALRIILEQYREIFLDGRGHISKVGERGWKIEVGGVRTLVVILSLAEQNPEVITIHIKFGSKDKILPAIDTKGEWPMTRVGIGWTRKVLSEIGYNT